MKKAFTLVELLAVIILLGLLGLIIYPTVNGVINNNKQKLHDKQISELIRHGNTYSTENMNKLKTYDGARNIVTIKDLYDVGLIQNSIVIDPKTDQELTGCLALTWYDNINGFDIDYLETCENSFNLSGTINNVDSVSKVELIQNRKVVYETNTDINGNYEFRDIVGGNYILLVSQPYKTKWGEEISVLENKKFNMNVSLMFGDINGNDVIDENDRTFVCDCIGSKFNGSFNDECIDEANGLVELSYDLDNNKVVNLNDRYKIVAWVYEHKISHIVLKGQANIKGEMNIVGDSIFLHNNETRYDAVITNNKFTFESIPKGFYYLEVEKEGYLTYSKPIYLERDIEGISAILEIDPDA